MWQFRLPIIDWIDALKVKVGFSSDMMRRLLPRLQNLDTTKKEDQDLLATCTDFAAGTIREAVFIAYLEKILPAPQ